MANFEQAYKAVVEGHEGGYVNDPNDPGGETICGVARHRCAHWAGWRWVDAAKETTLKPSAILGKCMTHKPFVENLVAIYKEQYWDVFYGDRWPDSLNLNASEVFDAQVNTGQGIRFLQRACNVMNRNEQDWPDVVEDNGFGPATWAATKAAAQKREPALLLRMQNQFQGEHYTRLMRQKPQKFERYIGWFYRI